MGAQAADLVLGAMYFGTRTDERTSMAILDRFVERGGRTIDTANCYAFWASDTGAGGQSEALIGRWLQDNPGLREDLTISTKVGQEPVVPGEFDQVEGLGGDVIATAVRASLERLGIDAIDIYWAHGEDRVTPMEQVVEAFGATVRDGLVRRLGVSNHPTWRVEHARALAADRGLEPFTALQLTTSYVQPRPGAHVPGKDHRFGFVTDETLDFVSHFPETELWAYSPLIQGSYDRADRPFPQVYQHPGTEARLRELANVAAELGATRGQVVLAWLLHRTPPIRPIVGVSNVAQLDEAMSAAALPLDADLMARLDAPR